MRIFYCLFWGGEGLRVRMGAERRFAPLLRIGAPGAISPTFEIRRVILPLCATRASPYSYVFLWLNFWEERDGVQFRE